MTSGSSALAATSPRPLAAAAAGGRGSGRGGCGGRRRRRRRRCGSPVALRSAGRPAAGPAGRPAGRWLPLLAAGPVWSLWPGWSPAGRAGPVAAWLRSLRRRRRWSSPWRSPCGRWLAVAARLGRRRCGRSAGRRRRRRHCAVAVPAVTGVGLACSAWACCRGRRVLAGRLRAVISIGAVRLLGRRWSLAGGGHPSRAGRRRGTGCSPRHGAPRRRRRWSPPPTARP